MTPLSILNLRSRLSIVSTTQKFTFTPIQRPVDVQRVKFQSRYTTRSSTSDNIKHVLLLMLWQMFMSHDNLSRQALDCFTLQQCPVTNDKFFKFGLLKITNRSRIVTQHRVRYQLFGALNHSNKLLPSIEQYYCYQTRFLSLETMVTKLRRNDGKRFTAPSTDNTPKPSVFTQLAKLERAKHNPSPNPAPTKFESMISKLKTPNAPPITTALPRQEEPAPPVTDLETDATSGWTIVVKNPKKGKKPIADATIVPEILYPENEKETMVPDASKAYYWPVDIKIRLRDNEAVNVQILLTCILNTFQKNDVHTVIVPTDYASQYDVEHFITKGTLIPAEENELRRYIASLRTYKESIIVQAIFMTKSLYYKLVENHADRKSVV